MKKSAAGPLERALAHHRKGEFREAEAIYRRRLREHPQDPDTLHLLGCVVLQQRRTEEALRLLKEAVAMAPAVPEYHENLAEAYHRSHRPELAEAECRLALRLDPQRPGAVNRLGVLAMERGAYDEARELLSLALRLRPAYAEALVNLAAVFCRQGEFDLAVDACDLALRVEPGNLLAWNNRGLAEKGRGRLDTAREAFRKAGKLPRARFNLGYLHLQEGDLFRGLPLLEERKALLGLGRDLDLREWDGKNGGRHLLVVHEQGMGDTLLMARFLPMLRDRFARVTVLVQPPLVRLLAHALPGIDFRAERGDADADRWCATMSLPWLLGVKEEGAIPLEPWIRVPGPDRRTGRFRAGINWAGNPAFRFDRIRSTHLDVLAPLLELPGVDWVSLHKGHLEEEAARRGLPEPLRGAADFQDTAEVVAGLDLVVSTETAVPNLSAAMGVPTILLAAVDHDWRWRTWYANVTVAAQSSPGDWGSAVTKAAEAVSLAVTLRAAA